MEYASGKRSFVRLSYLLSFSFVSGINLCVFSFFFGQAQGAFMGAVNSSDPMFTVPLELRDALNLDYDHPMSPYDKRSPLLLEYAKGLKALLVPEKLTLEEASSLMSIWKSRHVLAGGKSFSSFSILRYDNTEQPASLSLSLSANYDEQLLAKYTESGGNPRDFVWKGILSSFTSLECPMAELLPQLPQLDPEQWNLEQGQKNGSGRWS
jgi:hypothetical protein